MFVDVGRGAMDGAPNNFSCMSSYDSLGIFPDELVVSSCWSAAADYALTLLNFV